MDEQQQQQQPKDILKLKGILKRGDSKKWSDLGVARPTDLGGSSRSLPGSPKMRQRHTTVTFQGKPTNKGSPKRPEAFPVPIEPLSRAGSLRRKHRVIFKTGSLDSAYLTPGEPGPDLGEKLKKDHGSGFAHECLKIERTFHEPIRGTDTSVPASIASERCNQDENTVENKHRVTETRFVSGVQNALQKTKVSRPIYHYEAVDPFLLFTSGGRDSGSDQGSADASRSASPGSVEGEPIKPADTNLEALDLPQIRNLSAKRRRSLWSEERSASLSRKGSRSYRGAREGSRIPACPTCVVTCCHTGRGLDPKGNCHFSDHVDNKHSK